jgi:hypothetical protein
MNTATEQQIIELRQKPVGITFYCREDEMLVFHKDGKYFTTLYAGDPSEARELEQWLKRLEEAQP